MPDKPIRQIDEIYTLAKAMEAACQAATNMAMSAGASSHQVQQAVQEAQQVAGECYQGLAPAGSPLGEAQRNLVGRRELCRSISRLALEHGVDHKLLTDQLVQVTETAAGLYHASTLSDLGFAA